MSSRASDFFDGRNHPEITFESRRLAFSDDGTVALDGLLTMRGHRAADHRHRDVPRAGRGHLRRAPRRAGRRGRDRPPRLGHDVPGRAPARRRRALVERPAVGPSRAGRGLTRGRPRHLGQPARGLVQHRAAARRRRAPPARGAHAALHRPRAPAPVLRGGRRRARPRAVERLRAGDRRPPMRSSSPPRNTTPRSPGSSRTPSTGPPAPIPTTRCASKPVAVVGASTGIFGAVWAQAELRKVLAAAGADVLDDELPVGSAHDAFDEDLTLADHELSTRLEDILANLLARAVPREARSVLG